MEQSISAPFLSETQTPVSGVGFGIRFAARVIDMIVHYIIWYVAAYIIGIAINIYAMISGIPVSEILANSGSSSVYGFFLALFGSFFLSNIFGIYLWRISRKNYFQNSRTF